MNRVMQQFRCIPIC